MSFRLQRKRNGEISKRNAISHKGSPLVSFLSWGVSRSEESRDASVRVSHFPRAWHPYGVWKDNLLEILSASLSSVGMTPWRVWVMFLLFVMWQAEGVACCNFNFVYYRRAASRGRPHGRQCDAAASHLLGKAQPGSPRPPPLFPAQKKRNIAGSVIL